LNKALSSLGLLSNFAAQKERLPFDTLHDLVRANIKLMVVEGGSFMARLENAKEGSALNQVWRNCVLPFGNREFDAIEMY